MAPDTHIPGDIVTGMGQVPTAPVLPDSVPGAGPGLCLREELSLSQATGLCLEGMGQS